MIMFQNKWISIELVLVLLFSVHLFKVFQKTVQNNNQLETFLSLVLELTTCGLANESNEKKKNTLDIDTQATNQP